MFSAYRTLTPLLGSSARTVFRISLLASGLSASTVGMMAGQVIMQGFTIPLWVRLLGTIEHLQDVWERREERCGTGDPTAASEEMRAFGYWFTSQAFPMDWSVQHLVRALEFGGQIDNEHQVVGRLATVEDEYLGQAVHTPTLMTATDDEGWRILGWGAEGPAILERGRRSPDEQVRAEATL